MTLPWETPPVQDGDEWLPAFLKRDENNKVPKDKEPKFPWEEK